MLDGRSMATLHFFSECDVLYCLYSFVFQIRKNRRLHEHSHNCCIGNYLLSHFHQVHVEPSHFWLLPLHFPQSCLGSFSLLHHYCFPHFGFCPCGSAAQNILCFSHSLYSITRLHHCFSAIPRFGQEHPSCFQFADNVRFLRSSHFWLIIFSCQVQQ